MTSVYATSGDIANFYKDYVLVFKKLLEETFPKKKLPIEVIQIANSETIKESEGPKVLIKRANSPQPPSVAMLNRDVITTPEGNFSLETKNLQYVHVKLQSYGTTYSEAEYLGSVVFETLLASSKDKVVCITNGSVLGFYILYWSETNPLNSEENIFVNEIEVKVVAVIDSIIQQTIGD